MVFKKGGICRRRDEIKGKFIEGEFRRINNRKVDPWIVKGTLYNFRSNINRQERSVKLARKKSLRSNSLFNCVVVGVAMMDPMICVTCSNHDEMCGI